VGISWDWLGSGLTSPVGILLVRRDVQSTIESWMPGTVVAALSVSATDFERLTEFRHDRLTRLLAALGVRAIGFEMTAEGPEDTHLGGWLSRWTTGTDKDPRPLHPLFLYPDRTPALSRVPAVMQPKDVDQLRDPIERAIAPAKPAP
jgi:hypothetical protein